MPRYALVAVSGPLKKSFLYRVPDNFAGLSGGQRLLVPFGRSRKLGFFLQYTEPVGGIDTKDIIRTLDSESYFSGELFDFCLWMADYYFANPADCLSAALPSVYKKARGADYVWSEILREPLPDDLERLYKPGKRLTAATLSNLVQKDRQSLRRLVDSGAVIERWPDEDTRDSKRLIGFRAGETSIWYEFFRGKKFQPESFNDIKSRSDLKACGWSDYHIRQARVAGVLQSVYSEEPVPLLDFIRPRENLKQLILNEEQRYALEKLSPSPDKGFKTFLLHGVTGSGKTLVYCQLCRQFIDSGRTVLVLTPEIALTSTTLAYFRGFFGDDVTVMHSAMTSVERLESWRGIRQGRYKIVVGPRSAVFAPLKNPGLVIVDEEHDSSYKQDDPSPRFHGRDAAIMRAKMNDIPVLLGSASPSFESYHNAVTGRYELLELTRRPAGATLPTVEVVDMRSDRLRGDLPYISYTLKKKIDDRLGQNQQVIIYLNRRGHSTQLKCAECGLVGKCPNCRVNLTFHKVGRKLSCHYCGYLLHRYDNCPSCGGSDFIYQGVGTQKVEENIPRLFKQAQTVRLDSDSATGRKMAYKILTDFSDGKSNLLLGTQMVTKGLDLPNVTLVGVLSADMNLDLPEFRASEKAFARLLQVAGRSGRSGSPGEVIIQTYYPEHEVIIDAARQDYRGFYEREIISRQTLRYPPFSRIINFVLSAVRDQQLEEEALSFRERLKNAFDRKLSGAQILGPAPCPMYFLRGRYRRHLFVKTNQMVKLVRTLTDWESRQPRFGLPSTIKLSVDVDPDDMM
ncbi:MAG: primosomal protein N' [Candidatus Zixiibacteriota bacterium]